MVLGAAVGEATLGHRVGRKAALWGAVCGTLPDLDSFIPYADPVATFTYHRSFSHSLIVLTALTPPMAWLIRRIHPRDAVHRLHWYALVYLAFATHVLLDSFTIYGTQIFWPVNTTPITWGSIFIIDPLYTLPLAIGVIAVAVLRRKPRTAFRFNALMLGISTCYLAWSMFAKLHAHSVAEESLARRGIEYRQVVALAAPFNTILWRVVAMGEDRYQVGWYSLLDPDRDMGFRPYPTEPELLSGLQNHWPVRRLQWFTKGFYGVSRDGNAVIMTDLRMGLEGAYVFRFKVGEAGNPHSHPSPAVHLPAERPFSRLPTLWNRMLGRQVTIE